MSHKFSKGIIQLGGDIRYLHRQATFLKPVELELQLKKFRRILEAVYSTAQNGDIDLIPYYYALTDIEANLKTIQAGVRDVVPNEKIALFIDAANLSIVCRDCLGQDIDYEKLLAFYARNGLIQQAYYFTAVDNDGELYTNPFYRKLKQFGYRLVTKSFKVLPNGEKKGNLDIEIALDMLEWADRVDRVVLFSGDGDFAPLLNRMVRKGVRTEVVSYKGEGKNPTASELIFAADIFTDLADVIGEFTLIKKN